MHFEFVYNNILIRIGLLVQIEDVELSFLIRIREGTVKPRSIIILS